MVLPSQPGAEERILHLVYISSCTQHSSATKMLQESCNKDMNWKEPQMLMKTTRPPAGCLQRKVKEAVRAQRRPEVSLDKGQMCGNQVSQRGLGIHVDSRVSEEGWSVAQDAAQGWGTRAWAQDGSWTQLHGRIWNHTWILSLFPWL